jgi:predicted nuclease with TOPRIM domain
MATRKNDNGHDPSERMVRILESIEHEIHAFREDMNERLGRLETEAKQTNERLGRLETQAKKTNKRLSNVEKPLTSVEVRGTAALEERLERLEARVHDVEAAE